ncbi:hypothetical protein FZEAL_9032 [Fusarium zealandicum]|uniref:F-box domain-containing protein n=1 Tax=Fusarium zealandicum TaxID=1053134 RepID=A0A8H4UDB5_9HYPO|nr:hypothetical protein FZEAL_9032 [Fusarium zealandicum]
MATTDSLPGELIDIIFSNVTAHDLAQLSRTCKRLNRLAEPHLWTDIEFHHPSVHRLSDTTQPLPMVPASCRFYHWGTYSGQWKAERLFEALLIFLSEDTNRLRRLCARVESICTTVRSKNDIWQLLPYFTNLQAIELHGDYRYFDETEHTSFDVAAPTLSKLRYAKLIGHVPVAVAAWILESGIDLERLELGMLDRGIGSKSTMGDDILRLPHDIYSPADQPTYGRLQGWAVIPRPLSGFLPRRDNGACSLKLPRLRHLHLCQPSQSNLSARMVSYFWSTSAEVAAHLDWEQILLASSQTLETLVVEQRIGIEYGDGAVDDAEGFLRSDQEGLGSKRLMDVLEKVLTEEALPALKRVHLKGIVVGSNARGKPIGDVPGGHFMRLLEKMNVECDARLGEGCWFDGEDGATASSEWEVSTEDGDDPVEEELLARI